MRLIDADELIEKYGGWYTEEGTEDGFIGVIEALVNAMPSVQPERKTGKWIPCSERMPEEKDAGILKKLGTSKRSEFVLATVEAKGERMTVIACTYDGEWNWKMKYAFPDYKIIAWMPLPEPYQEGEQDDLSEKGNV